MNDSPIAEFTTSDGRCLTVHICERRRYGRSSILTWILLRVDGEVYEGHFANDPWPAVNFPYGQIVWELRAAGFDIPPCRKAIKWAQKMAREDRIFVISRNDRHYLQETPKKS